MGSCMMCKATYATLEPKYITEIAAAKIREKKEIAEALKSNKKKKKKNDENSDEDKEEEEDASDDENRDLRGIAYKNGTK